MNHEWIEDHFKSWDGAELFCRFHDVPRPRHTLVILHGHGEHSGRYLKFSERLKHVPVRLALFDYRGMGRSTGLHNEGWSVEDHLKDISAFIDCVRKRNQTKERIILMGHSLGGFLAVEWGLANPEGVKRLVLSAPFFGLYGLHALRMINGLIRFLAPNFIYRNPVMPSSLSHDPAEVAAYRKDPLIKRSISAALLASIMSHLVRFQRRETVTLPVPVNMLAAGKERIVDAKATRKFFDRLVAPKKNTPALTVFTTKFLMKKGRHKRSMF